MKKVDINIKEQVENLLKKTKAISRLSLPKRDNQSFVFEIKVEYFENRTQECSFFMELEGSCNEILGELRKILRAVPFEKERFRIIKSRVFLRDNSCLKTKKELRPIEALVSLEF